MQSIELIAWIGAFGTGGLFAGVLVYSLGSFALMQSHAAKRPLWTWLRELVREVTLAMITQPLLPLYYLVGHRMHATRESRVPVVFVHGYFHNRVGFLGLARALGRKGVGPLYGFNYPWFVSIESNAKRLERFIERVRRETGSDVVDLVCHSMGGLVAMEVLRNEAAASGLKIRRLVTIATPHAGVAWRGPIFGIGATALRRGSKLLEAHAGYAMKVPTLSVFSTHDNIVHPKETSHLVKRGGRDVEVDGMAHLSILFSPAVADHVGSFLVEPEPAVIRVELEGASALPAHEALTHESEELVAQAAGERA